MDRGGTQSALVGRTGIKTDYSKAAQLLLSLSCYDCCLWRLVCTGQYWSGFGYFGLASSAVGWARFGVIRFGLELGFDAETVKYASSGIYEELPLRCLKHDWR